MDSQELCRMAFSPQSSPVYGGKTIVVAFADENSLPKEKEIFLVFEGSASRHITSVNRLNAFTLQAVIPGHDRSEVVQLSVCLFHDNQHIVVAQGKFEFMEDPVQIFAAWLLDSVHDANALDKDETIIQNSGFDFCAEDKSILDVQLASAFENLTIPHSWSIVGDTSRLEQEPPPRETLLHFAARQGFSQFAMLLLNKPGSDVSLRLPNKHGEFPRDIARERGLDSLVDTMHEYTGDSSPECENRSRSYRKHCIGTATVTNKVMVESNTEIDDDIKMLREITSLMKGEVRERLKIAHTWPRVDEDENDDGTMEDANHLSVESPTHLATVRPPSPFPVEGDVEEDTKTVTPSIPKISIIQPSDNDNILEDNIRLLHNINEGIQKNRQHQQTLLLVEECLRKDNLSRFSSSCPSLAVPVPDEVLQPAISMVTVSPYFDQLEENNTKEENLSCSNVSVHFGSSDHIYVKDVTEDSSNTDNIIDESGDTLGSLGGGFNDNKDAAKENNGWGHHILKSPRKKDRERRKSWCPGSDIRISPPSPKKSYEQEDIVRSFSLSSLDGIDDSDSDEQFVDAADEIPPTPTSPALPGPEPEQQSTSVREKSEATVKSDDDINVNVMSPQCDVELKEQLGRPRTMSQGAEDVNDAFVVKQRIRGTLSVGTLPRYQGTIDARQDSASSDLESRKDRSTAYGSYLQLQELIKEHDKQHEKVVSDKYNDEILKDFMLRKKRTKARMSLTEFLTDPRNFQGDEDQSLAGKHGRSISGKTDSEKKSSSSMFNFFRKPSQRPRNKEKHKDKSKSTHHFVAVSVSNSAKCDYCDKPLVNKDAVKCQVCSINTHDTCKESIGPCSKVSKHPKDKPPAGSLRDKKFSVSTSELSKAISFTVKDKPRPLSFYYGQNSKSLPGYTVPKQPPITSTIGRWHWHRAAVKLGVSRQRRELFHALHRQHSSSSCGSQPINEEMEDPSSQTNISETLSGSMESLDEDATDDAHYENDPDLVLKDEPESWSVMVDKKKKKGLSKLDIKRQDVIYEMIQTEKHHVRTLKIMQKIFCHGMRNELNMDPNIIDKMFPMLSEIIEINTSFLNALKFRQGRSVVVDKIGDVLVEQFSGENGERMKYAYGIFCAHQAEAVAIYKEYKSDKKFLAFIKKCSQNTLCRRWSIQECILAVTHRITKYPLLIEAIIKATKANKADYPLLQEANTLVKNILNSVNAQVMEYEREQKKLAIYNKIDAKSSVDLRNGKKFKKSDILNNNRKLCHEGEVSWRSARGKYTEVIAILLSDVLMFFQENNQKYTFSNLDQKCAVVPLHKLMVRNVATDKQSIYLISPHKYGPEMYEIQCSSTEVRDKWRRHIEDAVKHCPDEDEDEGVAEEEVDEKRKQAEAQAAKVTDLLDQMKQKDTDIQRTLADKWNLLVEMTDLIGKAEVSGIKKMTYMIEGHSSEIPQTRELLMAAIQESVKLTSAVYGAGGLSRSATSVGESESGTYQSPSLPKRAETFGGFDSTGQSILQKGGPLKKKYHMTSIDSEARSSSSPNLTKGEGDSSSEEVTTSQTDIKERRGSVSSPDLQKMSKQGNAVRSLSDADKTDENRQHSTSPSFLQAKLHQNSSDSLKDENGKLSDTGSDRESIGDLSNVTDSGMTTLSTNFIPPTTEQVTSVAQLTYYLNSLLSIIAQRDTQYERMRAQLTSAGLHKNTLQQMKSKLEMEVKEHAKREQLLKEKEEQLQHEERVLEQDRHKFMEEKTREENRLELLEDQIKRDTDDLNRIQQHWKIYGDHMKAVQHQRQSSASSSCSQEDSTITPSSSFEGTVEWVSTKPHAVYTDTHTDISSSETTSISSYTGHSGSNEHLAATAAMCEPEQMILVPHLHPSIKSRTVSEPVTNDMLDSLNNLKSRRVSEGPGDKKRDFPGHLYSKTNETRGQPVSDIKQKLPDFLEKKCKPSKKTHKERRHSPNPVSHNSHERTTKSGSPTMFLAAPPSGHVRKSSVPLSMHLPRSYTDVSAVHIEKAQLHYPQQFQTLSPGSDTDTRVGTELYHPHPQKPVTVLQKSQTLQSSQQQTQGVPSQSPEHVIYF